MAPSMNQFLLDSKNCDQGGKIHEDPDSLCASAGPLGGKGASIHPSSLWEASGGGRGLSVWKEIKSPFEAADLTHKGFYF